MDVSVGDAPEIGLKKIPKRLDEDIEPVCWMDRPKVLYQELSHMVKAQAWICFTSLDDQLPEHCVENKIPYLGFVLTDDHKQLLRKRIISRVFACFQDEGSPLFQPGLLEILGGKAGHNKKKVNTPSVGAKRGADGKQPDKNQRAPKTSKTGGSSDALKERLAKLRASKKGQKKGQGDESATDEEAEEEEEDEDE